MFKKTTIEGHCFFVHKPRKVEEPFALFDFFSNDLYEVLKNDIVNYIDEFEVGEDTKNLFRIPSIDDDYPINIVFDDDRRCIYGILESGIYGEQTSFVSKNDKDKVVYKKKLDQAEMRPFFFLIKIPPQGEKAIMFFERVRNQSVATLFHIILKNFLTEFYIKNNTENSTETLTYKRENLIISEMVEDYVKKGDYSRITISKSFLPPDCATKYGISRRDSKDFKVELNVIAKKPGIFKKQNAKKRILKLWREGMIGFFTINDFENIGLDEESDVKIVSRYNDKKKTIPLNNAISVRPYYEIFVTLNNRGFSNFKSIKDEIYNFMDEHDL